MCRLLRRSSYSAGCAFGARHPSSRARRPPNLLYVDRRTRGTYCRLRVIINCGHHLIFLNLCWKRLCVHKTHELLIALVLQNFLHDTLGQSARDHRYFARDPQFLTDQRIHLGPRLREQQPTAFECFGQFSVCN